MNDEQDRYLIATGLLHGIATMQNSPIEDYANADIRQMELRDICAIATKQFRVQDHTGMIALLENEYGCELDLWPDHESLTDADILKRNLLRAEVEKMKALAKIRSLENQLAQS